jgi:hypothetical protein
MAAACALGAPAAHAAPTDVQLRIEGRTATLYEGPLRTTALPVDGDDGSGPHDCNAGASAASALTASGLPWAGNWNRDFRDFFLGRIAGDDSDPETASYWSVLVDWRYAAGICRGTVPPGGEVLLAWGGASRVLRLEGPAQAAIGEPFTVTVRDGWVRASTGTDGGPVAGASVGGAATGDDGRATVRFDTSGLKRIKASAPDAIRSNALDVCVGDARCEGALPSPTPQPPSSGARLAITVPAAGERYARGGSTLRLRGTAPGDVKLALSGRRGKRCTQLVERGRMARRACGRLSSLVTVTPVGGSWSVALKGRLAPGAYRLTATAGGRTTARRFTVAAEPATLRVGITRGGRWLRTHRARSRLFADWAAIALGRVAPGSRAHRRALRGVRAAKRTDLAALERAALALTATGERAHRRATGDRAALRRIRAAIARRQNSAGAWPGGVDATAYAVLALSGGGHGAAVRRGRAWLRAHAPTTGPDTIGAALWALGRRAPPSLVTRLRALQNPDGGFGDPSNAQSTALAVIGLEAAGLRAKSVRADTRVSAVDYLRARQAASGRVAYARGDRRTPVWVTAQALIALDFAR